MKKIQLIAIAVSISLVSCAQKGGKNAIPEVVKEAFKTSHPGVTKAHWEQEDQNFEVSFMNNKQEQSMVYDASGKLLETEVEIAMTDLPQAVKDAVANDFPNARVKETAKITDAAGKIVYEVEIKNQDYLFNADGTKVTN